MEIVQKIQDLKERILASKIAKVIAGISIFLFLLVLITPFFVNSSNLKFKIEQKISEKYGANFAIHGKVSLRLFPTPAIIANKAVLKKYKPRVIEYLESEKTYNLYVENLTVKTSLFGDEIKEIILDRAILERYFDNEFLDGRKNSFTKAIKDFDDSSSIGKAGSSSFFTKLFSLSESFDKEEGFISEEIEITNSQIIYYDKTLHKQEIKAINLDIEIDDEDIELSGQFTSQKITSQVEFEAKFNSQKGNDDSFLQITSPVMELRVLGSFTSKNRGILSSDFSGTVIAKIFDLKNFYKSYIDNDSVIFHRLKQGIAPIKISADVKNDLGEIEIANMLINSSMVNGKGDLDMNLTGKIPLINIFMDLDSLDLENIYSTKPVVVNAESLQKSAVNKKKEEEKNLVGQIKDFALAADITIKDVKYLNSELKDVDLYLTVSRQGEVMLLPLIFKIPGGGIVRVNGILDNSSRVPKFIGKFDAQGDSLNEIFKWLEIKSQNLKFDNLQNYKVYSDILSYPNEMVLDNFYLNLNQNESELLGKIQIQKGKNISNISSQFRVSNFDMDEFFLTSNRNSYLSLGRLDKKLLWLNNLNYNSKFKLAFDKLTYNKEDFINQKINFSLGRGFFKIENTHLKSDETDLNLNLLLNINNKNPRLELSIASEMFKYNSSLESSLIKNTAENSNFMDQFYALPSLEGFAGKVRMNFKKLELDDTIIHNLKMLGNITNGNIDSQLNMDLYGGNVTYKGMLGIKNNKIMSGNLMMQNILLQPIISNISDIDNISAIANISAGIASYGDNKESFSRNLKGDIKFNLGAVEVKGYGLNSLVKKMFLAKKYYKELANPEAILFNEKDSTIFKKASGSLKIVPQGDAPIKVNLTSTALNAILSGSVNTSEQSTKSLLNVIFLTGNSKKQTPINIATSLSGNFGNITQKTNYDQILQYLGIKKYKKTKVAVEKTQNLGTKNKIKANQMPNSQLWDPNAN